jgi:hypothetical protein
MTAPLQFLIQDTATGLWVAACQCAGPLTPNRELAASYGLDEAVRRAEELGNGNPVGFRLVEAESFAFYPS